MQLWNAGDRRRVDSYLEQRGLSRHELFARLTQAVLELAERSSSDERSILESIQNHLRAAAVLPVPPTRLPPRCPFRIMTGANRDGRVAAGGAECWRQLE